MKLTLGGTALSAPSPKVMGHAAYGFWDAFITMGSKRNEAIALWQRMRELQDRVENYSTHPKIDAINDRIAHLESKIMQAQREFLAAEVTANRYWSTTSSRVRREEEWWEMVNVSWNIDSLLGIMWRNPMSEAFPAPPVGCRMSNVVLQFAPPSQIAAYSMGGAR